MEHKQKAQRWNGTTTLLIIGAILVGAWLLRRYILGIALPFLLAWVLSRVVKPLVERLCGERTADGQRRRHLPRAPVAAGLVSIMVGGTVYLAYCGIRRSVRELKRLVSTLAADENGIVASFGEMRERLQSISAHIPLLQQFENPPGYADFCARLDGMVETGIDRVTTSVSTRLPDAAMAVAEWLPSALIFITITLLACYYFCADDGRIGRAVKSWGTRYLPASWREALPPLGQRIRLLGRRYLRACVWLGCLTFLLCFIGLAILGVPYAFLLAFVIALVDFLPLLGAGTVLLPWALVCLILGDIKRAIGLAILWGVCTLVRQVAEPRLIGGGLGLHPLLSLVAMYAGLRLWGLGGMILAPFVVAVVKGFLEPVEGEASLSNTTPATDIPLGPTSGA